MAGDHHGHSHENGVCHGHGHAGATTAKSTSITIDMHNSERKGKDRGSGIPGGWSGLWSAAWSDPDTARLSSYVIVTGLLFCFEYGYGVVANSLSLKTSAFHTLSNCSIYAVAVMAIVSAKLRPSASYSYGFSRAEVLGKFTNAIFLLFIALTTMEEASEQLFAPTPVTGSYVIPVAVMSLAINLVGLVVFGHSIHLKGDVQRHWGSGKTNIVVAYAAACLFSCACVVVSDIGSSFGWPRLDGIMAITLIVIILASVVPVTQAAGTTLLQSTPMGIQKALDKCLRDASSFDGVLECRRDKCHFWSLSPGVYVGTILMAVRSDANEQVILSHVTSMFAPFVTHLTIEMEKGTWTGLDERPLELGHGHAHVHGPGCTHGHAH